MRRFIALLSVSLFSALPTPLPSDHSSLWDTLEYSEQVIHPDHNIPEVKDAPEIPQAERGSATHAYSVDITFHTTPSDMKCFREKGYKSVFVRALNPSGNTSFDREVLNTIHNAYEAGLGSEVYITPNINSTRSGVDQINLAIEGLRSNGINVGSIWIQVTSPTTWRAPIAARIDFIQEMIMRAKNLGLSVGIYTSFYDWLEITGAWRTFTSDVYLWYWHVLGVGSDGETAPSIEDFRLFGPWKQATVKQFGKVEKVCGMIVNRNVYATRSQEEPQMFHFSSGSLESKVIRVGGIGF